MVSLRTRTFSKGQMSCGEERHPWSVFDGVKTISIAPEPLMAEISAAIAALEYARASPSQPPFSRTNKKSSCENADEAYKAGLASMAAGRDDEAVDETSAVSVSYFSHVSTAQQLV